MRSEQCSTRRDLLLAGDYYWPEYSWVFPEDNGQYNFGSIGSSSSGTGTGSSGTYYSTDRYGTTRVSVYMTGIAS